MPRTFNATRAAAALAEANLKTDREIAIAYSVGIRTIESWRSRLRWDEQLQREYQAMTTSTMSNWISRIPDCFDRSIDFIMQAAENGEPTNPEMVKAITGAIGMLNEVQIIQEAIVARKAQSVIASRN
ncbi:MAG TPA: hypothetical protein V6C84_27345 [Coleofasciculaceae cyanobacterium]|jgi:hypothetical protein